MQVQDATVLLHGIAVAAVAKQAFVNGKSTDERDGIAVTLMHEGGFAVYKIAEKWLGSLVPPSIGEAVTVKVRPYAIAQEGGRVSFGYSFVAFAEPRDLDQFGAALMGASAK